MSISANDYGIDADRVSPREGLWQAVQRRVGGRFPVDPFGLDPHLCDQIEPLVSTIVPVEIEGAHHIPYSGGAIIVANRGFGFFEPAALAVAVRRQVGRRLRIIGAPATPLLGNLSRRLGAIAGSDHDISAAVRAEHLVAVPLSPTWLRTGAGSPPLELLQVMTLGPVIPAAVTPGGPFGTGIGRWKVRVGAPVTLTEPYPAGDALGAARLAEQVRDDVQALLECGASDGDADDTRAAS